MIKHAFIGGEKEMQFLEQNVEKIVSRDEDILTEAIYQSCEIKRKIVEEDETEEGLRQLLNLGHTIAHALEKTTDFTLHHGEAVALGLLVEAYLSFLLEDIPMATIERLSNLLKAYGLPLRVPKKISYIQMKEAMSYDKKSRGGRPFFVNFAWKSGDAHYSSMLEEPLVEKGIEWMNKTFAPS
jgi:3-dehydroquinate synthase